MPNFFNNTLDATSGSAVLSGWSHPDYSYYAHDWVTIRDCLAGERRVKEKRDVYLPNLDSNYTTTYDAFLARAVFTNMVARTVSGLVGTVFRRPTKVFGVASDDLGNVSLDGCDFNIFCKKVCYEVVATGRLGILVDVGVNGGQAYLTEYIAENIICWRTETRDGRQVPTYILLREIVEQVPTYNQVVTTVDNNPALSTLTCQYRALMLDDNGDYKQVVFEEVTEKVSRNLTKTSLQQRQEIFPEIRGNRLKFIPFKIIGPMTPTFDVQRSPMLDITTLNLAHYRTSAQLEHGRFYTALPIYYVPVQAGQEKADYFIGPATVWEVAAEAGKPGILEYFGTGLGQLAASLVEKEEAIAQLGGRTMGIRPAATSESGEIYKLKQANEMATLLNITDSMALGMTEVLKWYLDWNRIANDGNVSVEFNQDFKQMQIAAREMRAIALLYQAGILPVQEVYRTLQDAEFIGEDVTEEEFIAMLSSTANFPGQPDVSAMHQGFPDASGRLQKQISDDQIKSTETLTARQTAQQSADQKSQQAHDKLIQDRTHQQQTDMQAETFKQGRRTMQFQAQQAAKNNAKAVPAGGAPGGKPKPVKAKPAK